MTAGERKGRGRLSAIDLLPREADPHVAWALGELEANERTQKDILAEFNSRLATLDPPQGPISPSAFNRTSMEVAKQTADLARTREIAGAVVGRLDGAAGEDVTILLVETIKTLTLGMLRSANGVLRADKATAEMLAAAARAVKVAEESKRISGETRARVVNDFRAKAEEAAGKVADKFLADAKDSGIYVERSEMIRRVREDVYGIFE